MPSNWPRASIISFANLPVGQIFGRSNWFVAPTDAWRYLPQDDPALRFAHVDADNAGDTLFLRCERQTLRRLPGCGAVLFTIGIAISPFHALSAGLSRVSRTILRRCAPVSMSAAPHRIIPARWPFMPRAAWTWRYKRDPRSSPRNDWTREDIAELFDLPFTELVYRAAQVHRENHPANEVQLSTLLSIKTGGCVEDCGYCSQSVKADSGVKPTKLMEVQSVLQAAARAKDNGSSRFCMGAAWRNPKDRDMPAIIEMVKGVRGMGLETCMTLGMLTDHQA
jgi:hypothetical protein